MIDYLSDGLARRGPRGELDDGNDVTALVLYRAAVSGDFVLSVMYSCNKL
jgi:hypothetical protein